MKKLLLTFLVLTGLLAFTACSYESTFVIHEDCSVTATNRMWYGFDDMKQAMEMAIKFSEASETEKTPEQLQRIKDFENINSWDELIEYAKNDPDGDDLFKDTIEREWNGKKYIASPDEDETQEMTAEEAAQRLAVTGATFDKDTFVLDSQAIIDGVYHDVDKDNMTAEKLAEYQEYLSEINYLLHITMPSDVAFTNGELADDGRTVTFDMNLGEKPKKYYIYTKNSENLIIFGVEDGGYTKNKSVSIDTPDKIKSIEVNGSSITAKKIGTLKDGKYTVSVKTENSKKTISFIKDSTKPTITGVKNGETYTKAVTIKFSDKTSGIKSAKLGKKTIKSGTKVKKPGTYTLKVVDNAGNKKTVKFTIAK